MKTKFKKTQTIDGVNPNRNQTKKINKNQFIDSHLARLYRILISIYDSIFGSSTENIYSVARLFNKIGRLWKTNGMVYTIKYLKSARLHATRYMVGQPLISREHSQIKVSLDKDYFPKIFLP